ncbi:hypothetical protein, conserved [Babesia bigemina]|uniref:Uncharacterized protein n=1 Tax=Babesia bigemina TaxID=5866 RepID=A0A061BIP2_BABBI|nr:hypothetical protein, conserved [Babesia bigemina]CDR71382.1 hypothetical protein, conserved [Babesia bigemina]|eukprot:XP_012770332.1 hypothetical protein, conserved [Babesia bigemina]
MGKKFEDCGTEKCKIKCNDVYNCKCKCCEKKCREGDSACKAPAAAIQQLTVAASHSSTGAESSAPPGVAGTLHSDQSLDSDDQSTTSTLAPPPYSAIAAVIVGIIVAIILLDLCIFRFPVGRNIRDFLVRKIPFCIAFYS